MYSYQTLYNLIKERMSESCQIIRMPWSSSTQTLSHTFHWISVLVFIETMTVHYALLRDAAISQWGHVMSSWRIRHHIWILSLELEQNLNCKYVRYKNVFITRQKKLFDLFIDDYHLASKNILDWKQKIRHTMYYC